MIVIRYWRRSLIGVFSHEIVVRYILFSWEIEHFRIYFVSLFFFGRRTWVGLYVKKCIPVSLMLIDFTLPPLPSPIPTIIQFGASSPFEFSRAISLAAPYVSGVDLNCGCPQSWACAECLGAALMNKRELVAEMVTEAQKRLKREGWADTRTVSIKIRIHKDLRQVLFRSPSVQPLTYMA